MNLRYASKERREKSPRITLELRDAPCAQLQRLRESHIAVEPHLTQFTEMSLRDEGGITQLGLPMTIGAIG